MIQTRDFIQIGRAVKKFTETRSCVCGVSFMPMRSACFNSYCVGATREFIDCQKH